MNREGKGTLKMVRKKNIQRRTGTWQKEVRKEDRGEFYIKACGNVTCCITLRPCKNCVFPAPWSTRAGGILGLISSGWQSMTYILPFLNSTLRSVDRYLKSIRAIFPLLSKPSQLSSYVYNLPVWWTLPRVIIVQLSHFEEN